MTLAVTLALAVSALGAAGPQGPPRLLIDDPAELASLERSGFDAGTLAFGLPVAAVGAAARRNDALAASRAWRDVVDVLRADLGDLYRGDPAWGVGMRFTHRGFDLRWLTSADARWQLVAVVNRVDRRAFHPGTCGELRFVYRLGYTTKTKSGPFSSRLPATLNVVFFLPEVVGEGVGQGGGADGEGAACRPAVRALDPLPDVAGLRLKAVEVNLQTARWPSTVRPDLGGHADYVLRVFHRGPRREEPSEPSAGYRLIPARLENTPDVELLRRRPALKQELGRWLADNLAAIDQGTAVVPDRFLATRAVSVTPRGLARPQNRPWTRLFTREELASLAFAGRVTVGDAASLLRRLDGLTCMGCHQSRSLAGFHIVGRERESREGDALVLAVSPHVEDEIVRRRAWVDAVLRGRAPDELRRPAEHGNDRGGFGDACGLMPSFSSWRCAAGHHCVPVDDGEVGQCMPDAPAVGSACRPGAVDFRRDRIPRAGDAACSSSSVCEAVGVGFPGGMCAGRCSPPEDPPLDEHVACGGIALLTPFNECLARGELFSSCAKHARPAGLRACGPHDPCRPDYLCAKTAAAVDRGVCLPPYFVLQMRVDGHPAARR